MKRILIPLCLVVGSHVASGQRSHQFEAPDRLFIEGKELFMQLMNRDVLMPTNY